jgi:hypothetical protein
LLVATTDLDESETVVSNLGSIAVTGGKSARTLFRDLLVASSSILGAFEPVITSVRDADGVAYQALHVDGGVAVPFFIAPEAVLLGLRGATSSRGSGEARLG